MRFSIYAKTEDGKVIQGKTDADDVHAAFGKAHTAAKSNGHTLVKVTVKRLSDEVASDFKVIERKAKGATGTTPATAAGQPAAKPGARKR